VVQMRILREIPHNEAAPEEAGEDSMNAQPPKPVLEGEAVAVDGNSEVRPC
jgi:hypothetical protein